MTEQIPADVLDRYYTAEKETAELLNKMIDAHRTCLAIDETARIASILGQIEAAHMSNPEWSHQLLAVAVDRLARAEK